MDLIDWLEVESDMYQITATVTILDKDGYMVNRQVPCFHLNENIHGLQNPKQAAEFARKMILDLIDYDIRARVATFALEV